MPSEKSENLLVKLFRRETSSKEFIPQIDGLRFLAISMVVFYHIGSYLSVKTQGLEFSDRSLLAHQPPRAFLYGNQGVELFFVISGFILAVPFMRFYLGLTEKKTALQIYFLRRLTRLEPPYILSLVILFFLQLFVAGSKYSVSELIKSFFWSVFYIHNFVKPGEFPYLNGVTWSLEIEVQFYIFAPLLVWLVCRLKNKFARRFFQLILIASAAVFSWVLDESLQIKTISLANFLQYFLAGIFLCDLYLSEWRSRSENVQMGKKLPIFLLGAAILAAIIYFPLVASPEIILRILSPLLILAFYIIVFTNDWWRKIFSLNALTLIGGMCYTIYLFHYQIISFAGRFSVQRLFVPTYDLYYLIQAAVFCAAILTICAIYFLLVEKPCMARGWHLNFYRKITFGNKNEAELPAENKI